MLTRIKIRNFKRFDDVDVELGKAVVLIGPKQFRQNYGLAGHRPVGYWRQAME